MTFHQNPFLGTFSNTSDFEAALNDLDDKVFYKDGSRSMEGTLSMDDNLIIGNSVIEMNNQISGPTPIVGKLSLYSKTDKKIYVKDDTGLETELSGGGDVDSSSIPSIEDRVVVYDGTSGLLIKQDSSIKITSGAMTGITGYSQLSGSHIVSTGSNALSLTTANDLILNETGAESSIQLQFGGTNHLEIDSVGIGFFNANPVAKPTITGSRSANVALGDLLTDMSLLGLIIDSTTAGTLPGGDVLSASNFTADNRLIRSDTISGVKNVQESVASLTDAGILSNLTGIVSSGNVDFKPCSIFAVTATENGATACLLQANGGTASEVHIENLTGTTTDSIGILSSAGGIKIDSSLGMNITTGGLEINSNIAIACSSAPVLDLRIPVFDGTTGGLLKETNVQIDVNNNMSGVNIFNVNNIFIDDQQVTVTNNGPFALGKVVVYSGNTSQFVRSTPVEIDASGNITVVKNLDVDEQITAGNNLLIDTANPGNSTVYGFNAGLLLQGAETNNQGIAFGELANSGASGNNTIGIGYHALIETGSNVIAIGSFALSTSGDHSRSTAIGTNSQEDSTAVDCTSYGHHSLLQNTSGLRNIAFGGHSSEKNTIGSDSVSIGYNAGQDNNPVLNRCTLIGNFAMANTILSSNNIALGYNAGSASLGVSSNNIWIGNIGFVSDNNNIRLGNSTDHTGGVYIPVGLIIEEPGGGSNVAWLAPSLSEDYTMKLPTGNPPVDERQTFTNLNGICSWSDSTEVPLPPGYIVGMRIAWTSVSSFQVSQGVCRSGLNQLNLVIISTLTVNMGTTGVLGIQTSDSELSSTWYGVWVIGDTSGVNNTTYILTEFGNVPDETGYDVFRRIGSVRNNSSSDLYRWANPDNISADRFVMWDEPANVLELLVDGSATVYTNLDIIDLMSPYNRIAYINTKHIGGTSSDFATFYQAGVFTGTTPATNPRAHRVYGGASGGSGGSTCFYITTDSNQQIEYANSSASEETSCWVLGYIDNVI